MPKMTIADVELANIITSLNAEAGSYITFWLDVKTLSAQISPMNTEVKEVHSATFPSVLEELNCSLVVTTYQAGQAITIGTTGQTMSFGFSTFQQAMGVTRTSTGLALASKHEVWTLPAQLKLAKSIRPEGTYDIAFTTRSCHITGPVMGHELAWCDERLVLVNTLCNCLATLEAPWSFVPLWKPDFISDTTPGDRCHLNGVAVSEDGNSLAYVTLHGRSNEESGWRENKTKGGVVIEVATGDVLCCDLAMPHSPRLHQGNLYVLNSGAGQLLHINPTNGKSTVVIELPGFTRGLDIFGNIAIVGLSKIRETAVFGGLPLQERQQELRCGVALVDLISGSLRGFCWFESGVEEIFSVISLPGYKNPKLIGTKAQVDEADEAGQTIWVVPHQKLTR